VEPGDELELPSAQRDVSLGRPHDNRNQHPLQADRARERMYVIGVERTNVVGDVELLERGGAVGRGSGGGHLALVRREALCCIPGAVGMNSKEGSWV
jgi:hypothetical protein